LNFSTSLNLRGFSLAVAASAVALLSGCAIQAPTYTPSLDNSALVKNAPKSVAVGAFTVTASTVGATSIGLRGSSLESPVGKDYAAYLAEALRKELVLAGKLDEKSKIEISGVLLKNDISAGGFATASGEIEARFIVKNDGQQRYDKVQRAYIGWESSFVGAIAIPKAQQQYTAMVQKLLSELFADAEFQKAIR